MSESTPQTAEPLPVIAVPVSRIAPASGKAPALDAAPPFVAPRFRGRLGPNELWWSDQAGWLKEHGYQLRPRYQPGWVPSWEGTKKQFWKCEDGLPNVASVSYYVYSQFIDAVRMRDERIVALKKVIIARFPDEVSISQFFSEESLATKRENHCVPVLDVLYLPDGETVLLVLPLLRAFDNPPFGTLGEVLDFCGQGLDFMHQHNVAHSGNVMMDPGPLYPEMFHPISPDMNRTLTGKAKHFTRSERPVKYYFIDFGISGRYSSREGISVPIHIGGDRTVPEFQGSNETHNPFPTDVYYVGNLFREELLQRYKGLDFLKPLVDDMVQQDPGMRPTAADVHSHFRARVVGLTPFTLNKRLARKGELFGPIRDLQHSVRTWTVRLRQFLLRRQRQKS
ncbi:hypothetical protein EIP86_008799 [Pleurotus ostreatoroseus]|nr:hypothetical protein EIP86_008799 [Pleurotus ostreatoroseus]